MTNDHCQTQDEWLKTAYTFGEVYPELTRAFLIYNTI